MNTRSCYKCHGQSPLQHEFDKRHFLLPVPEHTMLVNNAVIFDIMHTQNTKYWRKFYFESAVMCTGNW